MRFFDDDFTHLLLPLSLVCKHVYNSVSGSVKSPEFPCSYPNNAKCHYIIKQLDPVKRITIRFKQFSLQGGANCTYDSVKIYDGYSTNATQLGPSHGYCGNNKPPTMTSAGDSLLVAFVSDGIIESTGFLMDYFCKQFLSVLISIGHLKIKMLCHLSCVEARLKPGFH